LKNHQKSVLFGHLNQSMFRGHTSLCLLREALYLGSGPVVAGTQLQYHLAITQPPIAGLITAR